MNSYLRSQLTGIPTLSDPPMIDPGMSTRGKLRNLSAVNMINLSIPERMIMIHLSLAHHSDDAGRLAANGISLPSIPGLSASTVAKASLNLQDPSRHGGTPLLRRYTSTKLGGQSFFEVAGAYNYTPGIKSLLFARSQEAIKLKKERTAARELKNSRDKGHTITEQSEDNADQAGEVATVSKEMLSASGNRRKLSKDWFLNFDCPTPDHCKKTSFLRPMPETSENLTLRFYPSFNVYEDLTPLQTCIRFFLESQADGYGRVRVDVHSIVGWLGTKVMLHLSKKQVEAAIKGMEKEGHLMFGKGSEARRKCAFIRDSAQLAMDRIRYDHSIPTIHEAQDFHYSSERYKGYFTMLTSLRQQNTRVILHNQLNRKHLTETYSTIALQAEEWFRTYDQLSGLYQRAGVSDERISWSLQQGVNVNGYNRSWNGLMVFWHAVKTGQDLTVLNAIFNAGPEACGQTDNTSTDATKVKALAHFLFGGSVQNYLTKRNLEAGLDGQSCHFGNCWHSDTLFNDKGLHTSNFYEPGKEPKPKTVYAPMTIEEAPVQAQHIPAPAMSDEESSKHFAEQAQIPLPADYQPMMGNAARIDSMLAELQRSQAAEVQTMTNNGQPATCAPAVDEHQVGDIAAAFSQFHQARVG